MKCQASITLCTRNNGNLAHVVLILSGQALRLGHQRLCSSTLPSLTCRLGAASFCPHIPQVPEVTVMPRVELCAAVASHPLLTKRTHHHSLTGERIERVGGPRFLTAFNIPGKTLIDPALVTSTVDSARRCSVSHIVCCFAHTLYYE